MMNHKCKDDVLVEEHKEEGALSPVSIAPGFRWLEVWSALCVSQEESPGSLHEVIDSGYCHVFGKISFLFIFWVVLSAWMLDWEMYPCKLSMALCGLATSASPVVISLFKSKMGLMSDAVGQIGKLLLVDTKWEAWNFLIPSVGDLLMVIYSLCRDGGFSQCLEGGKQLRWSLIE